MSAIKEDQNDLSAAVKKSTATPHLKLCLNGCRVPVHASTPNNCHVSSPSSCYYDLILSEDAPDYEAKICRYLAFHDIHMSHPSVKKVQFKAYSDSPGNSTKESSLLNKRKHRLGMQNFKDAMLMIEVPIKKC